MTPPSLRILMTADAVGGVWTYATSLASGLCVRGHQVRLVTLGPKPADAQLTELRDIAGLDVVPTDLALEWMDPEGADFCRARARLAALAERTAPDIVHLNGYREALAGWQAPVLVVAHSCVYSWWRACRGGDPAEPRWWTYGANIRAGLAAADRWVAPTAAYRDQVETLYSPATPGETIRNGIAPATRTAAKQPVIFAAGRLWDEAKNVVALARAARRLPWPVRIAGPFSVRNDEADHGGFAAEVAWLGELKRPALMAEMQQAAIFAAPALYEPFGLTVLEAALAGCALVLADIPTLRELWDGAALFFEPRDEAMLVETLARVAYDEPLRRTLQRRAAFRAQRYSLGAMCDAYCELYAQMARAPRRVSSCGPVEARP